MSFKLFQYEHPLSVAGGAGPDGHLERVQVIGKFPNLSELDLEIKGKLFGRPPISICGLNVAKVMATLSSSIDFGAISGKVELGIKLDVPFLPEFGFKVVTLPDDLKR